MSDNQLIQALQNRQLYDHPIKGFHTLETHLSWIILTGYFAYKIKKPVDFGFVNYTTLEKRYHYCREELRLNQTLAPQIYKEVISINGTFEKPTINGQGAAIEYAVKMTEFRQEDLLNHLLYRNKLTAQMIDQLGDDIAQFHKGAACATASSQYGKPENVHQPVCDNFTTIRPLLSAAKELEQLQKIENWANLQHEILYKVFLSRKQKGYIRECHGDIHLGNIVLLDNRPIIFDCIDFNDAFRWIDVMADLAFLAMDFENHDYKHFGSQLINRYMEKTGYYSGLAILKYYKSYRAMVRAKVSLLHLQSPTLSKQEKSRLNRRYRKCLSLAEEYTTAQQSYLIITHGLAGSGKSTLSRLLVEQLGVIQIRSDIERKRIFGKAENLYSAKKTEVTYKYLLDLAERIIRAGYSVIVDATFLLRTQRDSFHNLAKALEIPFAILHTHAPLEKQRQWIKNRLEADKDPSEATVEVMERQNKNTEPLNEDEKTHTVTVDMSKNNDIAQLITACKKIIISPTALLQKVSRG